MSENKIIVLKFGGSSVGDEEKLRRVAEIISSKKNQGFEVVTVVSAMGDTTSNLLKQAELISQKPPRRELDMLVSAGERISMALLSMALHDMGIPAVSLTGSQCGIITNDHHFDARIIEVRPIRVQDEIEKGNVVIVAGYQGMSYKREITTLGRGGSDLTAVALTAALGAQYCEIYSDVDGVYSADPRIISNSEHLPFISYDEMLEMSFRGAKVLHDRAVEYAKQAGIVLYAKAVQGGGQTIIRLDAPNPNPSPKYAHSTNVWMTQHESLDELIAQNSSDTPKYLVALENKVLGFYSKKPNHIDSKPIGSISIIGYGINSLLNDIVLTMKEISNPYAIEINPLSITFYIPRHQVIDALKLLYEHYPTNII